MNTLSRTHILLLLIAIVAIGARIGAPYYIKHVVNMEIDKAPGITGDVEDINLSLFRGAYEVKGLTLYLQDNVDAVPTIYAPSIDISILWSAIFSGEIVGEVNIQDGSINFVDNKESTDTLSSKAQKSDTWLTLIESTIPIQIDKVTLDNTQVSLVNKVNNQVYRSYIDDISGQITNIIFSQNASADRVANYKLTGNLMGESQAIASGFIDPTTVNPTFDINLSMNKLNIHHLNSLVNFYSPIDIERGKIDVAAEVLSENGKVDGYVKMGIYNPDVFNWKADIIKDQDGLLTGLFEGLVDGVANLLEGAQSGAVATKVPINGTLEDTEVSAWAAFTALLRHSFINEYQIKVDNSIRPEDEKAS